MPQFGLFKPPSLGAQAEYEGDYMQMDKEYVQIRMYGTADDASGELVAAIRLDKGQVVRKME
jgi:hypothetical protein